MKNILKFCVALVLWQEFELAYISLGKFIESSSTMLFKLF